jgi:hypothetical protein
MTTNDMRNYICWIYGDKIKGQWVSRMSDGQVIAIYHSLQSRGITVPVAQTKKDPPGERYEQLSFL